MYFMNTYNNLLKVALLVLAILAVASAYVFGFRGERAQHEALLSQALKAHAFTHCGDPTTAEAAISKTTGAVRVTLNNLGGGLQYYTAGSQDALECPVVGPDAVSEECTAMQGVTDWETVCMGTATEETPDADTLSLERAEQAVREYMDAVVASAPPSADPDAYARGAALLSARVAAERGTSTTQPLGSLLGIQDIPDNGARIDSVEQVSEGEAVAHLTLQYSGGEVSRDVYVVAEGGTWKVDRAEEVKERTTVDQRGVLVRDNPGMPSGVWHISYERPGAPALTKALVFTAASICARGVENSTCVPESLTVGTRVRVVGELAQDGETIRVTRLELGVE